MSRWETRSELETSAAAAQIWSTAYVDADAWPRWNAEISRAELDGPLAPLWRCLLGPAAARALPEAQRSIAALAGDAKQ